MLEDTIRVPLPTYFSWPAILDYLGRQAKEPLYRIEEDVLYRAFQLDAEAFLCSITVDQAGKNLLISLLSPQTWPAGVREYVSHYVREWFDLERDLEPFYALAQGDPLLEKVSRQFEGLRLVGVPDLYEALTWGILGQQITLSYAYTLKQRLTESYGSSLDFQEENYWIYPRPEAIAQLRQEEL